MSTKQWLSYFLIFFVSILFLAFISLRSDDSLRIVNSTFAFFRDINAILLFSIITNAVLVLLVYRLWIWRNIISDGTENLVPEKWMSSFVDKYTSLGEAVQAWGQFSKKNYSQIRELADITNTLNSILDEKEKELTRYRNGFDAHLYRGFLAKFSAIHATTKKAADNDSEKFIEEIAWKLEDALEDCGVSIEPVKLGDEYSASGDLCDDNPKVIPNHDPRNSLRIAQILRQAYVLNTPSGKETVLPAKVAIYEEAVQGN